MCNLCFSCYSNFFRTVPSPSLSALQPVRPLDNPLDSPLGSLLMLPRDWVATVLEVWGFLVLGGLGVWVWVLTSLVQALVGSILVGS